MTWWLPSREQAGAQDAAEALRRHIIVALKMQAVVVLEAQIEASKQDRDSSTLVVLERRLEQLETNDAFLAAVAIELVDFDPAVVQASPEAALYEAVQKQLDRELGSLLREVRAETPTQVVLNRRSLGNEISRRLLLSSSDAARVQLDAALALLTDEERRLITTIYGEGRYKAAQRIWTGRRINELRQRAVLKLLEQLPELRGLVIR